MACLNSPVSLTPTATLVADIPGIVLNATGEK
jgi:hypothetical protein